MYGELCAVGHGGGRGRTLPRDKLAGALDEGRIEARNDRQ